MLVVLVDWWTSTSTSTCGVDVVVATVIAAAHKSTAVGRSYINDADMGAHFARM